MPFSSLSYLNQSYVYDGVNRLRSVADTGYSRSFCSDAWGNTWVTGFATIVPAGNMAQEIGGSCPGTTSLYNSNNRLSNGSYDVAGNQTAFNGNTLSYDAENRLIAETDGATHNVETYQYDGDGKRVAKAGPSGTTVYVYDAQGRMTAEYSTAASSSPCVTCYLTWDQLGSTRLVTDGTGKIIARHDYQPFGEEILASTAGRSSQWGPGTDTVNQKFTGKERDQKTGLDYFGARYYNLDLHRRNQAKRRTCNSISGTSNEVENGS